MPYAKLSPADYVRLTGRRMGELVAQGQVSPVQLAECALHLAKAAEPAINGIMA